MRGKERRAENRKRRGGITPAHAGKSIVEKPHLRGAWDHPRACGEKFNRIAKPFREQGSPPRMRGKEQPGIVLADQVGITPAHAGKRGKCWANQHEIRDHPRACGEK